MISKGTEKNFFEFYETNTHNEQVILASLFKSKKMRERIFRNISEKDFVGKRHQLIFRFLLKIEQEGFEFEVDTLVEASGGANIGGKEYIRNLLTTYKKSSNIDFHIQQLKLDRLKFDLFQGPALKLYEAILSKDSSGENLLDASSRVLELVNKDTKTTSVCLGEKLGNEYLEEFEKRVNRPFVGTGLRELDLTLTEGFSPGTISVLAGRPSMGKTVFMVNIIAHLMHSKKILICEVESGTHTIMDMLVALYSGIPITKLIKFPHKLTDKENKRIKRKIRQLLRGETLHFLDDPTLTLDRLALELRTGKYDICCIDLFGRLADVIPTPDGYTKKLYQAKRVARTTNTHLLLIHQMRRVKEEKQKRPTIDSLKDSGSWEEVGDLIFGVHREKMYRPQLQKDVVEIITLKQKRGESNTSVPFVFNGSICEFGDFVPDYVFGHDLSLF